MDFIEKVSQIVVGTGRFIGTKTKEIVDTANLKADIHANDVALRRAYAKLGRKYYTDHSAEEASPYAAEFAAIKELKLKKAEMEAQLKEQQDSAEESAETKTNETETPSEETAEAPAGESSETQTE